MNIADIVKRTVMSDQYITLSLQAELQQAKEANLVHLKNDILNRELQKINTQQRQQHQGGGGGELEEAIQYKYNEIDQYLKVSSLEGNSISDTIQQMQAQKVALMEKRVRLSQKLKKYVKTALQMLDMTWSILEELKKKSKENIQFDEYYTTLVDTLLIKVKSLHITILIKTYQNDDDFVDSLSNLSNLLEKRLLEAQKEVEYTSKKITEYNEMGPEFKILSQAHHDLLSRIQTTKDDIANICLE